MLILECFSDLKFPCRSFFRLFSLASLSFLLKKTILFQSQTGRTRSAAKGSSKKPEKAASSETVVRLAKKKRGLF